MRRSEYDKIERYMLECLRDSAHDREHVYRVLYAAMEIAETEDGVDYDILIAACMLHDIGRAEQFQNPSLCHAAVGGEKAFRFLAANGWIKDRAQMVQDCIVSHRFRTGNVPSGTEARILFDADKLDAAGAVGMARTLLYKGQVGEPLYSLGADGAVSDGSLDTQPSFLEEYKHKLEGLYDMFYTKRGKELAMGRRAGAVTFYENLLAEVQESGRIGITQLHRELDKESI